MIKDHREKEKLKKKQTGQIFHLSGLEDLLERKGVSLCWWKSRIPHVCQKEASWQYVTVPPNVPPCFHHHPHREPF